MGEYANVMLITENFLYTYVIILPTVTYNLFKVKFIYLGKRI